MATVSGWKPGPPTTPPPHAGNPVGVPSAAVLLPVTFRPNSRHLTMRLSAGKCQSLPYWHFQGLA
jgi:hypothetical protein